MSGTPTLSWTDDNNDVVYEWRGWLGCVWVSEEDVRAGTVRVIAGSLYQAWHVARSVWKFRTPTVSWTLMPSTEAGPQMEIIREVKAKVFGL